MYLDTYVEIKTFIPYITRTYIHFINTCMCELYLRTKCHHKLKCFLHNNIVYQESKSLYYELLIKHKNYLQGKKIIFSSYVRRCYKGPIYTAMKAHETSCLAATYILVFTFVSYALVHLIHIHAFITTYTCNALIVLFIFRYF